MDHLSKCGGTVTCTSEGQNLCVKQEAESYEVSEEEENNQTPEAEVRFLIPEVLQFFFYYYLSHKLHSYSIGYLDNLKLCFTV